MRDDDQLRGAARRYHEPPALAEITREEIWARVVAERRQRGESRRARRDRLRTWSLGGLGVAALLALGVGIGRWTASGVPSTPSVTAAEPAPDDLAYRIAATQYLSGAETFLTGFRTDVRGGHWDDRVVGRAGDLLSTTRLLLDSPAGRDARLRALLEELELILVQIAQLVPAGPDSAEIGFITQGLEQRGVLTKLRSAIPAGPAVGHVQGVL
jgi:hypothetical protein